MSNPQCSALLALLAQAKAPTKAPNYLFIDFSQNHIMVCLLFGFSWQRDSAIPPCAHYDYDGLLALVAMVRCTNFLGHNTKQDQTATAADSSLVLTLLLLDFCLANAIPQRLCPITLES